MEVLSVCWKLPQGLSLQDSINYSDDNVLERRRNFEAIILNLQHFISCNISGHYLDIIISIDEKFNQYEINIDSMHSLLVVHIHVLVNNVFLILVFQPK